MNSSYSPPSVPKNEYLMKSFGAFSGGTYWYLQVEVVTICSHLKFLKADEQK